MMALVMPYIYLHLVLTNYSKGSIYLGHTHHNVIKGAQSIMRFIFFSAFLSIQKSRVYMHCAHCVPLSFLSSPFNFVCKHVSCTMCVVFNLIHIVHCVTINMCSLVHLVQKALTNFNVPFNLEI